MVIVAVVLVDVGVAGVVVGDVDVCIVFVVLNLILLNDPWCGVGVDESLEY